MKKNSLLLIALLTITASLTWYGCQKDDDPAQTTFLPDETPYGKSYADWTIDWWKEMMVFDCANNPWLNPANALFYESGPVYFLAGISTAGTSVNVTVPKGKAILFPLTNFINDYPCPDTSFHPAPGQTEEEFLTEGVAGFLAIVTDLSVTVDGTLVTAPETYGFVSSPFYFTGNPELSNCFDGCVTGSSQLAVSGGYWMMLQPLSKGTHAVHYHSAVPWGEQDGTFNITVN